MEGGQTAWLGDVEPINFPLQPISHVLSLCPFLLMTHFLCPSAHFQARSEKESLGVSICLECACLCVLSVRGRQRERAHTGEGCPRGSVSMAAGAAGGEEGRRLASVKVSSPWSVNED